MTFGERLRKLRKQRGLTQDQLAELAGMNGRHLSRFETGAIEPPVRTVRRLAEALGLALEELTQEAPQARLQSLVPDEELLEQFKALSRIDEEDRKAIKRVIAAMLMKNQMHELLQQKIGA